MPGPLTDPLAGWTPVAPMDAMARGLLPKGPLEPLMPSQDAETNRQSMRQAINPDPGPMGPAKPAENKFPNLRTVDPSEVTTLPSPLGYMAGNAQRNAPQIGATLGAGLVPGGIIPRIAAAMGGGAAGGVVKGTDPLEEAGKAGLGQATGEALVAPLKFGMLQRAGGNLMRKMTAGNEAADTAFKEGTAAQAKGYQGAVTGHAEAGATKIVDSFKQTVPVFKDFPSDTTGLRDIVHGKGQEVLSQSFDKALKEVVAAGKGTMVRIKDADAQALGLSAPTFKMPQGATVYRNPTQGSPQELSDMVPVDAGQLAGKITGKWKTDPGMYRRVFGALDEAGLGNEAARSEYRNGQALIQFIDKSGAMKGGTLDPEKLLTGLTTLKTVNELRRRGAGDTLRGPLAEVGNSIPQEPSPLTLPVPQTPKDIGVSSLQIPNLKHPYAIGGGLGALMGLMGGHPGMGAGAGATVAGALSGRNIVTQAPLGPMQELATSLGPTVLGQLLRSLTGAGSMSPGKAEGAELNDPNQALKVPSSKTGTKAEWDKFITDYKTLQKQRGQQWNHDDQALFGPYVPPPAALKDQYDWTPEGYKRNREILHKDFSR